MIVDDDAEYLFLLNHALVEAGYQVIACSDPQEVVKKAKEVKPDLIILDLFMPREDGAEIGMKLKDDMITASTPVIFLTNLKLPDESETTTSSGNSSNVIIAKSHNRTQLFKAIKEALG
jgi:CheY-like chemotaxis protein